MAGQRCGSSNALDHDHDGRLLLKTCAVAWCAVAVSAACQRLSLFARCFTPGLVADSLGSACETLSNTMRPSPIKAKFVSLSRGKKVFSAGEPGVPGMFGV